MARSAATRLSVTALAVFLVMLALTMLAPAVAVAQQEAVASTLRSIFSPRRAPPQRTMGLAQRSFLDLVEQSERRLEIALLIDGTESMTPALAGVRQAFLQLAGDLSRYKQTNVAYQLVIYRDTGAPSGEVVFPVGDDEHRFTADEQAVLAALNQLQPESGAPYFPELTDEGVHAAIASLPWSDDENASRWIFLFADAPPFDPTFHEESTGARRRFATDALINAAQQRQIQINSVLCPTRAQDSDAAAKLIDQTRTFLNALSTGTGGLMLDLSYEDIRSAVVAADRQTPEVGYASIQTIRRADVQQLRQATGQQTPPVRIAVLPHAPLESIDFSGQQAATRLAAELRLRLKSIPGVIATEPLIVERRFRQITRNPNYSGLRGASFLQAIGKAVAADYLLWGNLPEEEGAVAATRLYDVATGEVLAEANRRTAETIEPGQLGALLAGDVLQATVAAAAHRPLATHLAAVRDNPTARQRVTRQVAASEAHDDVMAGLSALESALSYRSGDPAGGELLATARQQLQRAVQKDDDNAYPRFLLANCLYNLAQNAPAGSEEQTRLLESFAENLRAAYRYRTALPDGSLRREIEADYALLVRQQPGEAVPRYSELADETGRGDAARRANWMLAGIYSGDWGVADSFVDEAAARDRLIRILAFWPDSREAQFIRQALRWDDEQEATRYPHFPQENGPLVEQIDREA